MTGSARVPLVGRDQAGLLIRGLYPPDADASNITKALANSPDTLAKLAPLLGQVMNATTIDANTKELVVLRVSARNRCSYCIPTHEAVAARMGIDAGVIGPVASGGPVNGALDERSAAVVELCDRLVADPSSVDDALMERLHVHFEDHEIVELTVLAGAITLLNYVASAFSVPLDPANVPRA